MQQAIDSATIQRFCAKIKHLYNYEFQQFDCKRIAWCINSPCLIVHSIQKPENIVSYLDPFKLT